MAATINTSTTIGSYADIFREVTSSAKQLIQSEVELIKTEVRDVSENIIKHLVQAILFGALIIVSAVPLLASAVIALGQHWDGNYALSALVIGLGLAAISGTLVYRSLQKLKETDISLPATKATWAEGTEAIQRVAGDKNEIH